uniref:Ig-like domain-containing protein n=1 Tax=Myripristis murdjan TaxID=586833 RepID=A0A667Z2B7_9TELE
MWYKTNHLVSFCGNTGTFFFFCFVLFCFCFCLFVFLGGGCLCFFFLFVLFCESQLIGPTQPIVAMIGHDVILPCHLDPAEDATAMTVEWARPDLEPRFVHVLRDGLELDEKKYHLYMGRTSLLNNQLKHGDVSLKLATVKLSDEGKYKCFIPTLNSLHAVAVVLDCESKGWHPKPELFWLDAEGKLLSAGAPETVRGPDGLYTVSNSVAVEKSHSNSYTCRVQQHKIQQTRETQIHLEGEQYSKHMTLAFETNKLGKSLTCTHW